MSPGGKCGAGPGLSLQMGGAGHSPAQLQPSRATGCLVCASPGSTAIPFPFLLGYLALLVLSTRSELASSQGGEAGAPWPGERPATWESCRGSHQGSGHSDTVPQGSCRRGRLELWVGSEWPSSHPGQLVCACPSCLDPCPAGEAPVRLQVLTPGSVSTAPAPARGREIWESALLCPLPALARPRSARAGGVHLFSKRLEKNW